MPLRSIICLVSGFCIWLPVLSLAQDQQVSPQAPYVIVIKDHQFNPARLIVPAGRKFRITVDNQGPTEEEFESFDLDREQVVEAGKQIIVFLGPLKPGTYQYWGDFHQDTAKGTITAQ